MDTFTIRTGVHYLIAMALLAIYGIQVCPFLESLSTAQLLSPIIVAFSLQAALRFALEKPLRKRDLKDHVNSQFKLDLGLFVVSGLLMCFYNTLVYDFPLESGGKVVAGMTVLGFLIACELALYREYQIAQQLIEDQSQLEPDASPFPLSQKFSGFATLCAIAVIGVVFLVISKDLEWLAHAGSDVPIATAKTYILGEIIFIVATLMSYVIAIITGYSRNLRFFIHAQHSALQQVTLGDLTTTVPVTSNDEFGLIAVRTNHMIAALAQSTQALALTRDASILSLASLAETRDNETGGHILRTQHYVKALAMELRKSPRHSDALDEETIDLLYKSAPLHDIGKVGIPDNILLKPGKLTDDEFAIMQRHPQIGADALKTAETQLGSDSFLHLAHEIILTHHEKWDGSGYPNKLTGEDIPLSGRLMALADVYDALITKRVYKPAFSHEKARSIIVEGNGSHFDPDVVTAFLAIEDEFKAIAAHYNDATPEAA